MAFCSTTPAYESSERRESVEGEEEGEGGMKEEEEEQRPLCSGVLGYPLVRDHALGLRTKDTTDTPNDVQKQAYQGEQHRPGPAWTGST